jgi:hypothetical protein
MQEHTIVWLAQLSYLVHAVQQVHASLSPGIRILAPALGQALHMREQAIVWLAQLLYLAHAVQKEHASLPPGIRILTPALGQM